LKVVSESDRKAPRSNARRGVQRNEAVDEWVVPREDQRGERNFRKRLLGEHRKRGSPPECKVYSSRTPTGAVSYYFSPVAAEHHSLLIRCGKVTNALHLPIWTTRRSSAVSSAS
jgi:hypothetical protein